MPNKKSFDITKNEKKQKSSERFYQPKKSRWCKYIVLPLLAGFILLLILINVDFTGEAYKQSGIKTNARSNALNETPKENSGPTDLRLSRAVNCKASKVKCSLTCTGGNVNNLYKDLEPLYKSCQRELDLILIDCLLPTGKLKYDFFAGNYRLKSVNISNCNLSAIENKAFQQKSVKNLQNLVMLRTQFVALDAFTFEGLLQLENFYLANQIIGAPFKGERFLTPFSKTLKTLYIQQKTSNGAFYDPMKWLLGSDMESLRNVTLTKTNFGANLRQKTFSTLINVEYLDLSYSGITYLLANTFDDVVKTLKFLDLSYNHLTLLAGEMLLKMSGLALNLSFNFWDCSCANKDMLQIVQWKLVDIDYIHTTDMKCYTPLEERDTLIEKVELDCLFRTTMDDSETSGSENKTKTDQTNTSSSSASSSSSSTSSSNETSESSISISSETSPERETTKTTRVSSIKTTARQPMIKTTTVRTSIVTTKSPIMTTIPPLMLANIYCRRNDNFFFPHPIIKEKCQFSLIPLSDTTIKVITRNFVKNMGILYFADLKNVTIVSNAEQQQNELFIIINDLEPKLNYVFCIVQQLKRSATAHNGKDVYNLNISPFDCRSYSYSHYEAITKSWLQVKDQVWVISLVVLGNCVLLLLGMILTLIFMRSKKSNNKRYLKTLNDNLKMDLESSSTPAGQPYPSRMQPPDVVTQHVNYNCKHNLYEELTV